MTPDSAYTVAGRERTFRSDNQTAVLSHDLGHGASVGFWVGEMES